MLNICKYKTKYLVLQKNLKEKEMSKETKTFWTVDNGLTSKEVKVKKQNVRKSAQNQRKIRCKEFTRIYSIMEASVISFFAEQEYLKRNEEAYLNIATICNLFGFNRDQFDKIFGACDYEREEIKKSLEAFNLPVEQFKEIFNVKIKKDKLKNDAIQMDTVLRLLDVLGFRVSLEYDPKNRMKAVYDEPQQTPQRKATNYNEFDENEEEEEGIEYFEDHF